MEAAFPFAKAGEEVGVNFVPKTLELYLRMGSNQGVLPRDEAVVGM